MSDYERTAEPWEPAVPDVVFRTWDDVLALDPDPDDRLDRLSQEGAI